LYWQNLIVRVSILNNLYSIWRKIVPGWVEAFLWGLVVGSGLLIGVVTSYFLNLPHRLIAAIMGFGGGVLISVLTFELLEEAYVHGGLLFAMTGFFAGAIVFSGANWLISNAGGKHRKRCSACIVQDPAYKKKSNELAIAVGSAMDDIPEAIIVGIALVGGGAISKAVLIGFFLANIPEGLASASGMKQSGRSALYIFGVWGGITFLTGIGGVLGYSVFGSYPESVIAFITALAAGGILSMVAETMIPEAFEESQSFIGFITALGFMTFYMLIKTGW
jgi:ZIP family zinc transporter